MSDNYTDYIDFEEVSACCGASIIGFDSGLGHCAACGEWTTAAYDEEEQED